MTQIGDSPQFVSFLLKIKLEIVCKLGGEGKTRIILVRLFQRLNKHNRIRLALHPVHLAFWNASAKVATVSLPSVS